MLEINQRVKVTAVFKGEEDLLDESIGGYGTIIEEPLTYRGSEQGYLIALDDAVDGFKKWYFPVTGVVPRPAHRGEYDSEHWGEEDPEVYGYSGPGRHRA